MNETTWELDIDRQEHDTRQQRGTIACNLKGLCYQDIAVFRSWGLIPYMSHHQQGMCRHKRYGFCAFFGLKTVIDFARFGLESGMVFEGTTGVYEGIYRFNSK